MVSPEILQKWADAFGESERMRDESLGYYKRLERLGFTLRSRAGAPSTDCSECNGVGRTDCAHCSGTGKMGCPFCNGLGFQNSFAMGKVYRNPCQCRVKGDPGRLPCVLCAGHGKLPCPCTGPRYVRPSQESRVEIEPPKTRSPLTTQGAEERLTKRQAPSSSKVIQQVIQQIEEEAAKIIKKIR